MEKKKKSQESRENPRETVVLENNRSVPLTNIF